MLALRIGLAIKRLSINLGGQGKDELRLIRA